LRIARHSILSENQAGPAAAENDYSAITTTYTRTTPPVHRHKIFQKKLDALSTSTRGLDECREGSGNGGPLTAL